MNKNGDDIFVVESIICVFEIFLFSTNKKKLFKLLHIKILNDFSWKGNKIFVLIFESGFLKNKNSFGNIVRYFFD